MISHAPACVGWNKDKFVYVFDAPQLNLPADVGFANDTVAKVKPRDIGATCKAIFDLKENNSMGADEKFTTLMNKDGDAHLWVNTEQLYKNLPGMGAMSMMEMMHTGKIWFDTMYQGAIGNLDPKTGTKRWSERLAGRAYSSSPVVLNGLMYVTSEDGVGQVIRPSRERLDEVSKSDLKEKTFATFLPVSGALFVRTETQLYRFEKK